MTFTSTALHVIYAAFRRSGMADRYRYGGPSMEWRYYVDCKGYENNLTECEHDISYNTSRDVFISCNYTGTLLGPTVVNEYML